jgi:hypothetical protein
MHLDPWFLLVGWATVLVISLGKGAFGGGLAMLGVPLMSLVMSPVEAAILIAPLVALMDVFAVGAFGPSTWSKPDLGLAAARPRHRHRDRSRGRGAGRSGAGRAHHRPDHAGLHRALLPERPDGGAGDAPGFARARRHRRRCLGLHDLRGAFGRTAVALYLLRRGLDKSLFAGTNVAFFTVGNVLKLPPYLALGWDKPQVWLGALALTPAVPLGVWLGKRLHDRLEQKTLFFWCYAVLGLAARNFWSIRCGAWREVRGAAARRRRDRGAVPHGRLPEIWCGAVLDFRGRVPAFRLRQRRGAGAPGCAPPGLAVARDRHRQCRPGLPRRRYRHDLLLRPRAAAAGRNAGSHLSVADVHALFSVMLLGERVDRTIVAALAAGFAGP